jgi:hypothetical protein
VSLGGGLLGRSPKIWPEYGVFIVAMVITKDLIQHAITRTAAPAQRDPVTLAVGALVLYAFRAEINLHRDPAKGWSFQLRTKPISDTTLGRLLSQLLGVFGKQ